MKVLDSVPVEQILDPGFDHQTDLHSQYEAKIAAARIPYKAVAGGQQIDFAPGVSVFILGPVKRFTDVNDNSVVLRIVYGRSTWLLMGDAGTIEEKEILKSGAEVKADLLKVGHHGSTTSTSKALVKSVKSRWAVIFCGGAVWVA